jgi:DNA polymerase-3 subunit delta
MKISGARIEGYVKSPDAGHRAVLLFGPDGGLVRERADRICRTVVPDLSDPFRVADLAAAALKDDPARLADEAAAIAMTGGRRVVRVRDAGDAVTALLESFLDHPVGDALVVVEGGELGPRSSLRKLFEGAGNGAALACYADEGGSLAAVVQESLRAAHLTADPDALSYLVEHLGGDRRVTRSEMEKLALYMGSGAGRVRLEDAVACVGDSAALSLDDIALAAAEGDHATVQRVLARVLMEGTSPISVLRAVSRHFQRLHLAAAQIAAGKSPDQAVQALKPPPIFKVADRVKRQAQRWQPSRLADAMGLLVAAELDCKTTGLPAPEICGRALMQLARAAGRKG